MPTHTKAERTKRALKLAKKNSSGRVSDQDVKHAAAQIRTRKGNNPLRNAAEAVFKSRGMRKRFKPTVRKRRKRQALGA